jgi:hypothetical protein
MKQRRIIVSPRDISAKCRAKAQAFGNDMQPAGGIALKSGGYRLETARLYCVFARRIGVLRSQVDRRKRIRARD